MSLAPPRRRIQEKERRGRMSVALWGYSTACGIVLGAGGALITLVALSIGEGSAGFMIYAAYAAGLGAAAGFAIGSVVGLALGLIAAVSPLALRVEIMTGAIPVVALAVSMTPIAIIRHGYAILPVAALDLTLTVAGATWLLGRYRALEARYGRRCVH